MFVHLVNNEVYETPKIIPVADNKVHFTTVRGDTYTIPIGWILSIDSVEPDTTA